MTRSVVVALVLVFAALVALREHLAMPPTYVISDEPHIDTSPNRFVLPPSGFESGHTRFETLKNEQLLTPPHLPLGVFAYRHYLTLPKTERIAIRDNLSEVVQPAEQWITALARNPPGFLCIGESHQDSYREFLAHRFFPFYPLDALYLEAVEYSADFMEVRSEFGEDYVGLLRADIAEIIRVVRERNPQARIEGAEESSSQERARWRDRAGLRDVSLYENIMADYRPGQRHVALFGALHCNNGWGWLYTRLTAQNSPASAHGALNVAVMSRRKDQLTREFIRFLRAVGFEKTDLVITRTADLDERIHGWFLGLTRHFLPYESVVLFSGSPE